MGTVFTFQAANCHPRAEFHRALRQVLEWLRWVDTTFSTYRADSEISRLGRGDIDRAACAPEVRAVLDRCERLRAASNGFFDHERHRRLDPSGLVKGWAIDRASALLRSAGIDNHLVNGGGDIRAVGRPSPERAWRLGIAHPAKPMTLLARVDLCDGALATSGSYERGCHIDDPVRGGTAAELLSLSVLAADLETADGLATAGFAMGATAGDWLRRVPGIEAIAVTAGGSVWCSSGFPADLGAGASPVRAELWPTQAVPDVRNGCAAITSASS
jgi:thiamine biosynthesis lipoprotein